MIDLPELRATLARRSIQQWKLAYDVGVDPSMFSRQLRGLTSQPADLRERIERALNLEPGFLIPKDSK